jgi:hypothetical protein
MSTIRQETLPPQIISSTQAIISQQHTWSIMAQSHSHSPASTIAQLSTTSLSKPDLEKATDIEKSADLSAPNPEQTSDVEELPPFTPASPGPPPDGGLQAWLAVLGGFCTIFASFGWINCTSNNHLMFPPSSLPSMNARTDSSI